MPRFEAGDHVGKAAVQIQMCGQLPQPGSARGRSAAEVAAVAVSISCENCSPPAIAVVG